MIYGVDPSNASAGVARWAESPAGWRCAESETLCPWSEEVSVAVAARGGKSTAYVEVPQNGTHKSRGGVHWAGGMLIGSLRRVVPLPRRNVKKVTPSRWRRLVFRNRPDDWKLGALDVCAAMGLEVDSEDEAEAVLIGLAGVIMQGERPHVAVVEALCEAGAW